MTGKLEMYSPFPTCRVFRFSALNSFPGVVTFSIRKDGPSQKFLAPRVFSFYLYETHTVFPEWSC